MARGHGREAVELAARDLLHLLRHALAQELRLEPRRRVLRRVVFAEEGGSRRNEYATGHVVNTVSKCLQPCFSRLQARVNPIQTAAGAEHVLQGGYTLAG